MKLKRNRVALILAVMLVLIISTAAFAAEGKTVEVKGYLWEGMSDEEIAQAKAQISISNVIETLDVKEIDERLDGNFVTQAPAVITILDDGGVIFEAYKMTPEGNGYKSVGEPLPISGQAEVWIPDDTAALDENGYPKFVQKIVDAAEGSKYDDFPHYLPGCSVTLTEPGDYYVIFRYEAVADAAEAFIKVVDKSIEATPEAVVVKTQAIPTASKVMVNGVATTFDAYNINNNNYFKLRDLAKVVSGSEKQFEVIWDEDKNAINLVSNIPYTEIGGEMVKGDGKIKTATLNKSKIYKDGIEISLTAYTINGNNYFKLRDLAAAFNIGVTWDGATSTIGIDTKIDYVEE